MLQCNKIKIMPEALAVKIAAGEVIERPASVVKELVENSIDAGAADISIYIQDGGRKLIKVVDNGEGMTRDDAIVAFERHATSKILKEEDLYSISTMGFRGEALPSIASVSETVLCTKVSGDIAGTQIRIKGGKLEDISDIGCVEGATVEVRDIFFNTPARLKFMRSASAETGHISDIVTRLALSHPSVRFRLYSNKAPVFETSANAELKLRIAELFGKEFLKEIIPIEAGNVSVDVHGFIARPELAYSAARGLFIYVNNRWIRDRGINHAIASGYRNAFKAKDALAGGRYPFVILFVKIAPQSVDVNVHPSKCEARFRNQREVYEIVNRGIEDALKASSVPFAGLNPEFETRPYKDSTLAERVRDNHLYYGSNAQPCYDKQYGTDYSQKPPLQQTDVVESLNETEGLFTGDLEIIGQLWKEYILCERDGEFYMVDQHAAAERIAFERLKREYSANCRVPSQMLLIPQSVDLSLQEMDTVGESLKAMAVIGFDIEPFGGSAFIIRAVPEILAGTDCRGLIKDLVSELTDYVISFRIDDKLEDIFMRIACHSVIRGKRALSREEAKALLRGLSQADFSGNCPHGRPVVKGISRIEIEKMFKRR